MQLSPRTCLALLATLAAGTSSWSQSSTTPKSPRPNPGGVLVASPTAPTPPPTVSGYVITAEIKATAPELVPDPKAPSEVVALAGKLKTPSTLTSRFYLTQDLSRQEIVSTDFILPAGTVILHKAGERLYVVADPVAKTYLVMDADALLTALEGGAGVVNSQYEAKVEHTGEKKMIAGVSARRSLVTVSYVTAIPVENDRVLIQQKNAIEVWHTGSLVSTAATDHFFFKYKRDHTGAVQKALATDVGFPMEVNLVVTQGTGRRGHTPQPGSLHMLVTEVKQEKALDSAMFRIPPAGYKRVERNPYFAPGAQVSPAPARP